MKRNGWYDFGIGCLCIGFIICMSGCLTGCGKGQAKQGTEALQWSEMEPVGEMELEYANQFQVEYYEDELALITISDTDRYLLVSSEAKVPQGLDEDVVVIEKEPSDIYLAASSAMDFFRQLNALSIVKMTSTKEADWSIEEVKEAVASEDILYVGKYNTPDYEMIIDTGCDLAIESTMIYHNPETKEKLEQLGIPVMVEKSSYETEPLGRMEWIKLYGLLAGKESEAEEFFESETEGLKEILAQDDTDKTVAFFYISRNGYVNVRKPGDYISKMIEMAGGQYIFSDMDVDEEDARSTINMQFEDFYSQAVDADILIYNSTVDAELKDMSELLGKNELMKEFKAVENGEVYCTNQNMFQETTKTAGVLKDIYAVMNGNAGELTYLHKLK